MELFTRKSILAITIGTLSACGGGGGNGGDSQPNNKPSSKIERANIGGNISGLAGGEITLKNNSGDTVQLDENGGFELLNQPVGNYTISIENLPPAHECVLENASGELGNEGVNNIQVRCGLITDASKCDTTKDTDQDKLSDCDELFIHGTNLFLPDTDGDGFEDGNEINLFDPLNSFTRYNPRVSDLAKIAIDITSVPQIELVFNTSSSGTQTVATEHSQSNSIGVSNDWGGESTRQVEIGHTLSIETTQTVGTEVSVSLTDIGGSANYESSLSLGMEQSQTQSYGSSVNWSESQQQENTKTYNESREYSESNGTEYTGGTLKVTAKVRNDGLLAYDLENLTLSAFIYDPKRPFDQTPVGNLSFSGGGFPATSITTQSQSAPLNFTAELSLPKAQQLLRDSSQLVITPATYRLVNQDNRSALLSDQDIASRTATIIIDYGINDGRLNSHKVAVNLGRGDKSVSALTALKDILGLTVSQGVGQWKFGDETTPRNTANGLIALGNTAISIDQNSYWLAAWNHTDGNGGRVTDLLNVLNEDYDLNNIKLRAGDVLNLVYVSDKDRDGLADRFEKEYGTDPLKLDSDTDTLHDAEEIYGWLSNLDTPPCDQGELKRITSNPLKADSDNDGTDDATEKANCENPNFLVIAEAGNQKIVNVNSAVTLSGLADGIFTEQPSFEWRLLKGPNVLVDGKPTREISGKNPSFKAPAHVSTLVFELTVSVEGESNTDQVIVQVQKDRNQAVYVGTNTSDFADGSQDSPYSSLENALNNISAGDDLYVMTPTVKGSPQPYLLVNSLEIPDGTDLYGGYDSNWVRDLSQPTSIILNAGVNMQPVLSYQNITQTQYLSGFSLITKTGKTKPSHNLVTLKVIGKNQGTLVVEDNRIQTANVHTTQTQKPGSSYGAYVKDIAKLIFRNNDVKSGNGGNGLTGSNKSRPQKADNGNKASGNSGAKGGSGNPGGNGGSGGTGGNNIISNTKGSGGSRGGKVGSLAGGSGGNGGNPGKKGSSGTAGENGAPGKKAGDFNPNLAFYTPVNGNVGVNGGHGTGGGGGGGGNMGGTQSGGGGGGGGEGGTGGQAGTAGNGGGGSIGIWLINVPNVVINNNRIQAANGGYAGHGGLGAPGGYGGNGGKWASGSESCFLGACDRGAGGGYGGNGGQGGNGGDGSGGTGGPSFAIFVGANISPIVENNQLIGGKGGNGGKYGNTGNGGDSVLVFDANPSDGKKPILRNNTPTLGIGGTRGTTATDGGKTGSDGCKGIQNC